MEGTPTVSVPMRVAAPSLTVAGLAAWVFAHAGQHDSAQRCGLIQEVIDKALRRGEPTTVDVPRSVAEEAVELWEAAAALLDAGASVDPHRSRPQEDQQAAGRLRLRADRIRQLLREPAGEQLGPR